MKTIIFMVGLPRSGKTTLAKDLAARRGVPIVCPDAVRLALTGQEYRKESEKMVWGVVYTMIDALFLTGHSTIIFDACNMTEHGRRALRQLCDMSIYVVLKTSKEVCLKRTEDPGLAATIERMASYDDPVHSGEGYVFHRDNFTPHKLAMEIKKAISIESQSQISN